MTTNSTQPRHPLTEQTAYGWGFTDGENGTQEHKPEDTKSRIAELYWMGWNAAQEGGQ